MLLACAVLASMTPAQALAEEADKESSLQAGPAQTQNAETEVLPAQDGTAQESETVTEPVTEEAENTAEETAPAEEPAPEQQPAAPEETEPVVTETPAVAETPAATEAPVATEAPAATETPAVTELPAAVEEPAAAEETPRPDSVQAMPDMQTLQLEEISEENAVEYTITVRFHQCINLLEDWEWVHEVRTTTLTVDPDQAERYWGMDAAQLANAVVGSDVFGTADFWLNGHNQPVVTGSGTDWTVDLYVNLHAWGHVPGSYAHSKEPGSPWDGNLVCTPLYQIQNRSSDLTVAYSFQNAEGTQNGTLASGEVLSTSLAVNGIAAAIFFLKAPAGYTGGSVAFSDGTAGDIYAIDQISTRQGAYDFSAEIARAEAQGYTHAFYFTQWSGEERRWFSAQVVPVTYTITYDLDGGELSAANPLSYEVSDLENGGITLHNPTKTGYTFLGWTRDGSTGGADPALTITPGTVGNLSFTAHWQIRSDLSYTVQYLEQDTDKVLADARTVDGQTYGTTITEQAPAISGYRVVGEETRTITLDVKENSLVFYYQAVPEQPEEEKPVDTGNNSKPSGDDTIAGTGSQTGANNTAGTVSPSETNRGTDTEPAETEQASAAEAALAMPAGLPLVAVPVTAPAVSTNTRPVSDSQAAAAQEPAEEEVIPETDAPLAQAPAEQETIDDSETPLAASNGGWALLNLLLAVVTVLGGVLMLLFGKKNGTRTVMGLLPAVAAVVAFIVTENITMPMILVDRWTLLMALLTLLQLGIAVGNGSKTEDGGQAKA